MTRWTIGIFVCVTLSACAWSQYGEFKPSPPPPPPVMEPRLAAAVAQIATLDPARLRASLAPTVYLGGLWFGDAACDQRFGAPRTIRGAELDALAGCLARIELTASRRVLMPDVAIVRTRAGVELEAWFKYRADDARLTWIGFVDARDAHVLRPTVAPELLEAARRPSPPSAETQAALAAAAQVSPVRVWSRVCLDPAGAITDVDVYATSSPQATRAVTGLIRGWKLAPIRLGGAPTAVCSMITVAYPDEGATNDHLVVAVAPLEGQTVGVPIGERVAGYPWIPPTYSWWRLIPHRAEVVGVVRFCTDNAGHVERAEIYDPTGIPDYDHTLEWTVSQWRFAPTHVDGKPASACGQVAFEFAKY